MAPEIPLENQRPAEFVFEGLVKTITQQREEHEILLKAAHEPETRTSHTSDAA